MKTTLEIIDILYQVLNVADVKAAITGGVYKASRPMNSKAIDVVIGCLPTNNLQLQTAVANVNIHVPNLTINVGGVQDTSQPDFAKLRTLSALVISKLEGGTSTHWFEVQQQNIFAEHDLREHYSNIRVNFFAINIQNA